MQRHWRSELDGCRDARRKRTRHMPGRGQNSAAATPVELQLAWPYRPPIGCWVALRMDLRPQDTIALARITVPGLRLCVTARRNSNQGEHGASRDVSPQNQAIDNGVGLMGHDAEGIRRQEADIGQWSATSNGTMTKRCNTRAIVPARFVDSGPIA